MKDYINHNLEFDNHELGTELVTPANHLRTSRYDQRYQNAEKEGAQVGCHKQKKNLVSPNKNTVNREKVVPADSGCTPCENDRKPCAKQVRRMKGNSPRSHLVIFVK